MNDKELLELAAKAAGYEYRKGASGEIWIHEWSHLEREWNPLIHDADALQLAVKLEMSIEVHHDTSQPLPWLRVVCRKLWQHAMTKEYALDKFAATRRAITIAAAEIGKALP